MPTGVTALEKTLIGVEASAGATTDTVTTHWRGIGKIRDRLEVVYPPERVGRIGGTSRHYIPVTGGEPYLEGDATFEQLLYLFNAGIYLATPTTDASSAITRTWSVQSASTDPVATTDLGTLVIESGDNNDLDIARFCYVRELNLTGKQGEAMQLTATLGSRAPSTSSAFTAVGSTDFENPAETILFSKVGLYIDDTTGTIGATQKSETILDMTLRFTTGWVPLEAKDGRLDFSNIKRIDDEIMLDVTFEHNGVASAERAAWRAGTDRMLRLQWTGNAISTTDSGVSIDTKLFRMDLYGTWTTFGPEGLEEQNGDNIYRGTFRVAYVPVAAKKADFTIVNEVATLP